MKRILISCLAALFVLSVSAQDKTVQDLKNAASATIAKDANDTIPKTWKVGGLFSLNVNQAQLSNWAAGGDNSSFALTALVNAHAFYLKGKHSWDNTANLGYGVVTTTSLGTRKTTDMIDLLSKYGYDIGKHWYISGLFNFRTQFAPGYAYPTSTTKTLTSDLFAPAYVLLSPGFNYKPNNDFSFFISPATARWVIVNNDSLSAAGAYGVDPGKKTRFEFGAFASLTYNKKISPSATYAGRLDLFSNYLHNPQNISLYMTNMLAVKVSKYISMNLSVNFVYDNDIPTVNADGTTGGPKLQIQELFGLGFAYKF